MTASLQCPKCRNAMEAVEADGVEVDRCTQCGGLWFDAGELDWLAQSEVAEAVDVGDPDRGQVMNRMIRIDCLRCDRPMKHVADRYKTEIRYEICEGCEGVFLDAGEFQGLSRHSPIEVLRGLIRRMKG